MAVADPKTPTLIGSLSLAEIKELIAYAREQKVTILEHASVRFQFSPLAHDPPPDEQPKKTEDEDKSPHGHFKPV